MIYFSYNDLPSGIYNSQVIDVCRFLRTELRVDIRLVAMISVRGFAKNRKEIKRQLPDAIVLPMIPKHSNWKLNWMILRLLLLFIGRQDAVCRGVFATNLALRLRKRGLIPRVIFDGRGAYKAEFEEYLHKIVHVSDNIGDLERNAVLDSDHRIAVSSKLVELWKAEYGFKGFDYSVIPCTLSTSEGDLVSSERVSSLKEKLGYRNTDIVLVYSGSTADWQSIDVVDAFLCRSLPENKDLKVILLSKFDLENLKAFQLFPDRILQKWVSAGEVKEYLAVADYGLLIREFSVTNKVSSPTKFAEYLNAGLKIIISPEIGDFTDLVEKYDLGYVLEENNITLKKTDEQEKSRMNKFAKEHFAKEHYKKEYERIAGRKG